jgi:hypothetical protein
VVVALVCLPASAGRAEEPKKNEKPAASPGAVEVHFEDGSLMKMTLQEESIEIATSGGKKSVRLADLRKVDLALRLPEEDEKRVTAAVKALGSMRFADRERATAELSRLGIKAYPALFAATKAGDAETRKRAGDLIEKLKSSLPEEFFERVPEDVLWTESGKLSGKIEQTTWKANTTQFGVVQVKLIDVVRVRSLAFLDPEVKLVVEADPGTVVQIAGNIGKVYAFKVTGVGAGNVWGSGIYTSDSTIAMAAVHAGLVKVGQVGVVKVRIVPGQAAYDGSTKNGITTSAYGPWGGSYEFVK